MKIKRKRYFIIPLLILAFLFILWYSVEPWVVTFMDDGPYYSINFTGAVDELPLYSRLELNRLGRGAYVLESRLIDHEKPSVLLLREKKTTHSSGVSYPLNLMVNWGRSPWSRGIALGMGGGKLPLTRLFRRVDIYTSDLLAGSGFSTTVGSQR